MFPKYFKHYQLNTLLSSYTTVPALLNENRLKVSDIKILRIANHPAVTYMLLLDLLRRTQIGMKKEKGKALEKMLHRRLVASRGRRDQASFSRDMVRIVEDHTGHSNESLMKQLTTNVEKIIEHLGLYDTPDEVKARLAGTFSYDQMDDYEAELRNFSELACSECSSKETLRTPSEFFDIGYEDLNKDLPEVLKAMVLEGELTEFDYLTGPYVRCACCSSVIRAELEEASSLPTSFEYVDNDSWDYYVERLDELLNNLLSHAQAHGLPAPAHLAIVANHIRWDGATGYAKCDLTGEELAGALRVDSQFTVFGGELWLEPDGTGHMNCSLAHHDATGYMEIEPVWLSDLEDARGYEDAEFPVTRGEVAAARGWQARVAEALFCGEGTPFNHPPQTTFQLVSKADLIDQLKWQQAFLIWADEALHGGEAGDDFVPRAVDFAGNLIFNQFINAIQTGALNGLDAVLVARQIRKVIDLSEAEKE